MGVKASWRRSLRARLSGRQLPNPAGRCRSLPWAGGGISSQPLFCLHPPVSTQITFQPAGSSSSEPVFGFLSVPNCLLRLTNMYTPVGAQPLPQAGVGFCAHTYLLVIRMGQSRLSRASPSAAFALGVVLGRSRLARLGACQLDRSGHASTLCFSRLDKQWLVDQARQRAGAFQRINLCRLAGRQTLLPQPLMKECKH